MSVNAGRLVRKMWENLTVNKKVKPLNLQPCGCRELCVLLLDRIAHTKHVDAVYCYRPSSVVSVGRSVTLASPGKTAEPIEMPFGLRTRVGPGNRVLDCGPDSQ